MLLPCVVVVSGKRRREAEAIQAEMSRLEDPSVQASNPFWVHGDKARTFALLREGANQVPRAVGFYERVVRVVYGEVFPLNEAPRKLEDPFTCFIHPEDVRQMVRHQMHAGARCALALVHSHWPGVELMTVARGPPLGRDEPMSEHYAAATAPAEVIVQKILEETDRIVGARFNVKEKPDV